MCARRVILFGKTGTGKSSTGNSILGNKAFENKKSLSSQTQECKMRTETNPVNKRTYSVCDTPGILDTNVSLTERLKELIKAVEICKLPHAFLLVFDSSNRYANDEEHTVTILQILFGVTVFDHCVIVFTRGDDFETDTDFESFVKSSSRFGNLLEKCGKRVVRIENSKSNGGHNLHCLLEMIETVSDRGRLYYQYPFLDTHMKVLNDYSEKHMSTKKKIAEHLANISKNLDDQLMTDHKKMKAENEKLKKDNATLEGSRSKVALAGMATGAVLTVGVVGKIGFELVKAGVNTATRSRDQRSEPISFQPPISFLPQAIVPEAAAGATGPKFDTSAQNAINQTLAKGFLSANHN